MKSDETPKSADDTTPAAQPPASPAAKAKGATTAEPPAGDLDIAGALGLPAEGQETESDEKEPVDINAEAEKSDEESDEPAEGKESEGDDEDEAGKSEETEAERDEADEPAGESDEKEEKAEAAEGATEEAEPAEAKGKVSEGTQKRFDELTAARRTAEDEVKTLRETNATLRAAAAGELAARPLDFVDTPEQLKAAERKLVALHQWALTHEDGGKLEEREYTREEVALIRADTMGQLQLDVPARKEWLEAKQKADAAAVTSYPWLKDSKAGFGQAVQQVVESFPQLRVLPNYRLALANMVIAEKFRAAGLVLDEALFKRLSAEKAKRPDKSAALPDGKPALRRPPPAPARFGTVPSRTTSRAATRRAAEQSLEKSTGSLDDIARSIAAKLD